MKHVRGTGVTPYLKTTQRPTFIQQALYYSTNKKASWSQRVAVHSGGLKKGSNRVKINSGLKKGTQRVAAHSGLKEGNGVKFFLPTRQLFKKLSRVQVTYNPVEHL